MAIQNDMIVGMGSKLTTGGTGDLQKAFNSSQKSQAWFFSTAAIKMAAKYKPFNNTTIVFASETARNTARANANYGLTIPKFTAASDLIDADWTLQRPDGTSYPRRALDFERYYRGAPDVPVCCTWPQDDIVVNIINSNSATTVPFFVYQKTGQLKDWDPDPVAGMVAPSTVRSNTQIDAICSLSELNASGGSVITSLTEPYLGLAFFQNTTFKKFVGCPHPLVASQDVRDIDMYQLRGADITGLHGDYTAMACIRYKRDSTNYGYIPLPKGTGNIYKNKFNLKIGGADMYTYWKRGLSKTNTTSSTGTLRTTGSTVYATIRIQNNSGITHSTDPANYNKWILVVTITGTVNGSSITPPDRRLTMKTYPAGMVMANGESIDVTFQIDRIWNNNPKQAAVTVTSGSISIEVYLYYNDGGADSAFTRGAAAQQAALLVTYGN